ncbi:MAG TPA: DUF4129 domain-containing protein [Streptosporangiaceae bacterium]|nr:DUF4129 domain-containing protein [Streptosporangiaceae bacterium]
MAPLQNPDRLSWSARYARPVLVGLLLIVVLAGIRATVPAAAGTGPWHRDALPLAGAFELALAVLLVALWFIARRRPNPGYPAALLRAGLLRAIPLGMATVAVLAGLSQLHLRPGHRSPVTVPGRPALRRPRVPGSAAAQHAASLTYFFYALLGLLLIAAIVACVLVLLRRVPDSAAEGELVLPGDDDASLRAAIESGRRALRSFDDAQAAIIACYVAMEASLAAAGTARAAAETPDELLARAVGSGLLAGTAAGRLTALFYEARYSSHALPAAARDEAVRALDAISAELARQEEGSRPPGAAARGAGP